MSTTRKLWLGFGLLLLLLVGSGLFVARRLALVEGALKTIMAVQEPATAATYEMAVNVSVTTATLLGYASTGDPQARRQVDSLYTVFTALKGHFDRIARSSDSRSLGDRIAREHVAFRALGDSLIWISDLRRSQADEFAAASEAASAAIRSSLEPSEDLHGRDAARRALLVAQLDADAQGVSAAIGNFLRTRDTRYKNTIVEREAHFRVTFQQLRDLHLTDAQLAAVQAIGRAFDEFERRGGQMLETVADLRDIQSRFERVGSHVERLVNEGIHSLARTDLIEAQQSALRALQTSLIAVLVLLVAGIVIGVATAVPTGRSIVGAEARIREQAELLRQRMQELAVAHRRKDEFLGVLGHELRNPLAPLSNALHVLAAHDAAAPAPVREAHDMMRRQVHSISRLVDDLLDVSRINEGKITLRREPVDLGALCDDVLRDLKPVSDARHHRLERLMPARGPWVNADPTRLAQVVSNLFHNAVKYTPEGGVIRLEVESNNGEALLRVSDNGVGIAPEMQRHIFEAFVQADSAPGRQMGGLGIGLTLVQRLVEMHDGHVEVSSPGVSRGSTFTVRLPALAAPPEPRTPARPPEPVAAVPRRVLVVDDNRDAAETLARLLELWGHRVRLAHDGDEALAAAAAEVPEIVLLDIGLPGTDGYGVATALRQRPGMAQSWIIALTGFGQESDRRRALAAGFDDHMTKPVNPDVLRQRLAARPATRDRS